jgi:predicted GTPase
MGLGDWVKAVVGTRKTNESPATIADRLRQRKDELESASVRIGFIGETGSGKSSLINALLGRPMAREGVVPTEHSLEGEEYELEGMTLVDLPGCGAVGRPCKSYIEDLKLLESGRYDAFVLVSANRLKESDIDLFRELHLKAKKPFFVVRSHFDLAVRTAGDEAEARRQIDAYFRRYLRPPADFRVYMVAAPQPALYDLPALIKDLAASLSELKRVRLLMVVPAYTQELVQEKRAAAEQIVLAYAGLAAANGLNPIPGTDILVDLSLLQNMTKRVISVFGLRRDQLENLEKLKIAGLTLDFMLDAAGTVLTRLVEGGVVALLRQAGKEVAKEGGKKAAAKGGAFFLRYGSKLAPWLGFALSAGVGWVTAYYYGKFLLDECEEALTKIVKRVEQGTLAPA